MVIPIEYHFVCRYFLGIFSRFHRHYINIPFYRFRGFGPKPMPTQVVSGV